MNLYRKQEEKVKMKVDLGCHGMCVMVSLLVSCLYIKVVTLSACSLLSDPVTPNRL